MAEIADNAAGNGAASPEPRFVFVHIPKTAGTTLTTVLRKNEPGKRIRHLGNVFKGGGGTKRGATFERLGDANGQAFDGVKIFTGHVPLGISEYFPDHLDVRYFTFLRDPVDRTLSHYFQVREISQRRTGSKTEPLAPEATLEEALASDHIHDNLHTRMLSGEAEPFGKVDEAMLEAAKRNLGERVAFFGLTERFDASLVLAKRRLGLKTILYRPGASSASRGRVNASRPRGGAVPAELIEAARSCNRFDLELYDYAKELFEASPELRELEFEVELAALQAAKPEGDLDLSVPVSEHFDGGEEAWRMLLEARAEALRHEAELAEIRSLSEEIARRSPAAAEQLGRLSRGKRRVGRDPGATLRALEMLAAVPPKPASRPPASPRSPAATTPARRTTAKGAPAKRSAAKPAAKRGTAQQSAKAAPAKRSAAKSATPKRRSTAQGRRPRKPAGSAAPNTERRRRKKRAPAPNAAQKQETPGAKRRSAKGARKPAAAKRSGGDDKAEEQKPS